MSATPSAMTATETVKPTVIVPPRAWPRLDLLALVRSRELLMMFAQREVKLRYRQTVLGAAWIVLAPTLAAGIFSFVFSTVAHLSSYGVPYFLFAFIGMAGWTAFSNGLTRMSQALTNNAQMVTKIYFERLTLCVGVLIAGLVDLTVTLALAVIAFALYDHWPGLAVVTFPLWIIVLLAQAAGLGLMSGALMVRYRDLQPIVLLGTQLLLYLSPVAYGINSVPAHLRSVYELNPLAGAFTGLRWSLLGTPAPNVSSTLISAIFAVVVIVASVAVFRRQERTFADVI